MKPTVLVMTTVHWPDDTRIRERLIRTLEQGFEVVYACKDPGPSDTAGLTWARLPGKRGRRWVSALLLALRARWDVMVLHDPEIIPVGLIVRLIRRRPVVFDVHEDVPATAMTRAWVPGLLRRPLAAASRWLLRIAERYLHVTLAEPGYARLFNREHPVFPNYPDTSDYPDPVPASSTEAVYLGDVTVERGLDTAIEACGQADIPLRLIGRVSPQTRFSLEQIAVRSGAAVTFEGLRPNRDAMAMVAQAFVALVPLKDYPNYRHSHPTKLLEYLAVGVPVVASDLPGTRSLGEDLVGVVLVPPGDSQALAEGIERAGARRGEAAAQARRVRDRFRWPSDDVREFYRSLV